MENRIKNRRKFHAVLIGFIEIVQIDRRRKIGAAFHNGETIQLHVVVFYNGLNGKRCERNPGFHTGKDLLLKSVIGHRSPPLN